MSYPKNDIYTIYDIKKHRYILTEKYLEIILGVDMQSIMSSNGGVNSTVLINSLLDNISSEVYSYIYKHNNTQTLQYIIAKSESAKDIVKEAMGKQALYVIYNGDLGFSLVKEENEMSLNKYAKEIIDNQVVEETGTTLTYTGSYRFSAPSYDLGEY